MDAVHDVVYFLRFLRHQPGFAAVAILSLALGIGANTSGNPLVQAQSVREAILELDPHLPSFDVRSMSQVVSADLAQRRFHGVLLGSFALGAGLALAGTRFVRFLLFEVSPTDPGVLAAVSLFLLAVGVAACGLPAWRASRADPAAVARQAS